MKWAWIKQFPKFALVAAVLIGSTALFAFWWYTRSWKLHPHNPTGLSAEEIKRRADRVESAYQNLVLADNDLYDAETGELLFKNWLKQGVPVRIFFDPATKKMLAQYERGFVRYECDGRENATLLGKYPPAFSAGFKWAAYVKDKDIWKADIDWTAFKFTDERKVTSIGQFDEKFFAQNVILRTDKTLVVRNMNQLLRVNIETGDVHPTRVPLGDIEKRRSPDSHSVVGIERGQFYCYDVDADQTKTIPIGRIEFNDCQWLNNDRCAVLAGAQKVFAYERTTHHLDEPIELPSRCSQINNPSPDGKYAFCNGTRNVVLVLHQA